MNTTFDFQCGECNSNIFNYEGIEEYSTEIRQETTCDDLVRCNDCNNINLYCVNTETARVVTLEEFIMQSTQFKEMINKVEEIVNNDPFLKMMSELLDMVFDGLNEEDDL